jgi:hypothetical protein
MKSAGKRVAPLQENKGRRTSSGDKPGIHGSVLAVNQAYNFVVLSLGERQGVAANSAMLVRRRGVLIGKIRISSVEPTTAIGDIVMNTLARGVQVQPGDTVIYADTTSPLSFSLRGFCAASCYIEVFYFLRKETGDCTGG